MNFFVQVLCLYKCIDLSLQDPLVLADILHLGRAIIAGYETKGKEPDFEKLTDMANYFNVTIDYLMDNDNLHDFELSTKINRSNRTSLDDLINSLNWDNLTD